MGTYVSVDGQSERRLLRQTDCCGVVFKILHQHNGTRGDGRATTIVDPEMATLLKVVSIEHSSSSIVVTELQLEWNVNSCYVYHY